MLDIDPRDFPKKGHLRRVKWRPIMLRPILGSPEQFVVGVVAVSLDSFYIAKANCLHRLTCLYEDRWLSSKLVVESALEELERDLALRQEEALIDHHPVFSSILLGELGTADGLSTKAVATSWLRALSSLHSEVVDEIVQDAEAQEDDSQYDVADAVSQSRDPLPNLVWEAVMSRSPALARYFSREIREKAQRRRTSVHSVIIDFAGSRVVANFGTLAHGSNYAASIDRLKRRMWDLKIARDREHAGLTARSHELIVHRPSKNDVEVTQRQHGRISEALLALEEQADQEEIRMRPLDSIGDICDHLQSKEAA